MTIANNDNDREVPHLADPQFLPVAPLPLRLLELILAVCQAELLFLCPTSCCRFFDRSGTGADQITRRVSLRGRTGVW